MTNFIKLKDGETFEGKFVSFGENRYGVFMVLTKNKKEYAININNTVLKNLIKMNIEKFNEGANILITRQGKVKGKNYIIFEIFINGEKIESSSKYLSRDEVIRLL